MNELIFFGHVLSISLATALMLMLGNQALCAFLCVQTILANLFVLKQITLFGLTATASDIYIIGSVFSLNLIQEYYGKKEARKTIWISFSLLIFYTIVSQFQIFYTPAPTDFAQPFYYQLLSFMPRLTIASLTVCLMVQYFDTYFYGFLKSILHGKYLLARNIVSITTSQLLDTVLFSFFGLYGIMNNLMQIMIISFAIKLITIFLLAPIIVYCARRIKK